MNKVRFVLVLLAVFAFASAAGAAGYMDVTLMGGGVTGMDTRRQAVAGEFIAVDNTTEYVYRAPNGNPEEFFRVVYDKDAYVIDDDEQVTVQDPGM